MGARGASLWWVGLIFLLGAVIGFAQDRVTAPGEPDANHEAQKQLERELWFRAGRTVKDSTEPAASALHMAHQQKLARRAARVVTYGAAAIATVPVWQNLGPAPINSDYSGTGQQDYGFVSGRATAVAVDPNDPTGNTVYAATAYGGVWKSTNAATANAAAVTWSPLLDAAPTLAVGAIAVQPGNPGVVLAGTGEPNNAIDSYYGLGLMRSTDGGASWTTISGASGKSFQGLGFSHIAFNTERANVVVAAVSYTAKNLGLYTCSTCRGLFVSGDSGQTWTASTISDSGTPIAANSATTVVYSAAVHRFFAAVRGHGFYVSTDDSGAQFVRLANQPGSDLSAANCPATTAATTCPLYRAEMAVRADTNELFAWFVDAAIVDKGVWRSTDGGNSWTALDMSTVQSCGDPDGCGTDQGFYNLALAAVPHGGTTDVYAGAVNLFKCSVSAQDPKCSAGWLNLTHVYGCSPTAAPSHVHPDQHGVDFSRANPNLIYFANDGGIYRTLNGAGLSGGSCTARNPFDNLNARLGPVTQFVWLAQDPTNAGNLIGGTQDNGSPAMIAGASAWAAFSGGDGGWSAINPNNPSEWFTAYTEVEIARCALGTGCRGNFHNVVTSATVGGDAGAFYTPYMLDPQSTGLMIVGTCRVWRGNSGGGNWGSALSRNFTTGDDTTCTSSHDMVRALAAGGPAQADGSQVIYAGMPSGKLWVTTDVDDGPGTWQNRTISGVQYPISSVAIDPSDPTGLTAWATVMGFHTAHLFRTVDGGASWMAADAGLPDAPADAIMFDPTDPNVVYVGTDVGVFVTLNANTGSTSPVWTEYGTLPNVAITHLDAVNLPGARKMRVSTYGRGIWQADLAGVGMADFTIAKTAAMAGMIGQTVTAPLKLTALNGYSGTVTLTCAAAGGNCGVSPATISGSGTATLSLATSGLGVGSYPVNVTATDGTRTHSIDITAALKDITADFAVTTDKTSAIVTHGQSATANVSVASVGLPFASAVTLNCSGLPALSQCSFSPQSVTPGTTGATSVLTITTTAAGASTHAAKRDPRLPFYAVFLAFPAVVIFGTGRRRQVWPLLTLSILALVLMMGCGGGGSSASNNFVPPTPVTNPGTPAGTYVVTINAASGSVTHSTNFTLVVQ